MPIMDAFFNPTHPKGEEIPNFHDPLVPVPELLLTDFDPKRSAELEWQSLQQHDAIPDMALDELYNVGCLQSLCRPPC